MYKKIRGQDAEKKGIMENHADEKLQAKKSDKAECDKVLYKKFQTFRIRKLHCAQQ